MNQPWPLVPLRDYFDISKGKIGIKAACPGAYPLVTTGEKHLSHNEAHFEGDALCIPLVSATGHGHASIRRIHHITGQFSVGSILCVCMNKQPSLMSARFVHFFLSARKESVLVPLMQGSANVSLKLSDIDSILIPAPPLDEQLAIVKRLDALAEKAQQIETHLTAIETASLRLLTTIASRCDLSDAERERRGWRKAALRDFAALELTPKSVDASLEYPNVGILSYAKGLFDKPPINGGTTSAKTLYQIREGQFIYSRLFAFEGAYALVPAKFDGYFVSNEFPTFRVDPTLASPKFLMSLFLTESDWHSLRASTKGVGDRRLRIQPENLLARVVWLPPLHEMAHIDRLFDLHFELKAKHASIREANSALVPAMLERIFESDRGDKLQK